MASRHKVNNGESSIAPPFKIGAKPYGFKAAL
jgi:hypothetical protein